MGREMKEKRNTILIVDDEPQIRKMLDLFLTESGFKVIECETGKQAVRMTASVKPDLILLDLGLPDIEGKEALETFRQWTNAPVIVVTARPEEEEAVELLDAGADDYVTKPFNVEVLLARVRAALRKAAIKEVGDSEIKNGPIKIDLVRHEVFYGDNLVSLTPKEYDLLRLFITNRGKMLTHRNILKDVWGSAHTDNVQYLRVYIGQLRNKLGAYGDVSELIVSESGIGYRMEVLND